MDALGLLVEVGRYICSGTTETRPTVGQNVAHDILDPNELGISVTFAFDLSNDALMDCFLHLAHNFL
jgi:hypothetical protein